MEEVALSFFVVTTFPSAWRIFIFSEHDLELHKLRPECKHELLREAAVYIHASIRRARVQIACVCVVCMVYAHDDVRWRVNHGTRRIDNKFYNGRE